MLRLDVVYTNDEVEALLPVLQKIRDQLRGAIMGGHVTWGRVSHERALSALDKQLQVLRDHTTAA